ncbi:MAG TPA: hypothetical protein VM370_02920 [Candidatus Thermoplasmatota archaeon]|nr:hypothetical protein [Candidatus Thermoplasmatota archaeon]
MPARKAPAKPAKKAVTKKVSAKAAKPAAKKAAPVKPPAKAAPVPKPVAKEAPAAAPTAKKPVSPEPVAQGAQPDPKPKPVKRDRALGPVQKTRVVIPMEFYEPNKDAVKAPFKEHELKWNYLGEGKGLYKRVDNGVHCYTAFKDDGVHYSIWGDDKRRLDGILASWRKLLGEPAWARATTSGEQAAVAESEEKESEALKLWKMGEPQRRPGEPDLFYSKRLAEWQAKRPV